MKNNNAKMIALYSNMLDYDDIVDLLIEVSQEYKSNPTEINLKSVVSSCALMLQKSAIEYDGSLEKHMKKREDIDRRIKFFDTDNN